MLYQMLFKTDVKKTVLVTVIQFVFIILLAQPGVPFTKWTPDGNAYYQVEKGEIFKIELPSQNKTTFISKKQLTTPDGKAIVEKFSTIYRWKQSVDLYQCKKSLA